HHRNMIDFKMTGNLAITRSISIPFDDLLPQLIAVHLARFRRVASFTRLAFPPLTTHPGQTRFHLIFCIVAIGTFAHFSNLTNIHYFHHSPMSLSLFTWERDDLPKLSDA